MKNRFLWLLAIVLCIGITACSEDEIAPSIEIPNEFAEVTLAEGVTNQTITFDANQSWSASIKETRADEASWLTVSPQSGNAGKVTLTITAQDNYSSKERLTYIHIVVDGLSKSIPVKQLAGMPTLEDDKASPAVASNGFFVVNEDWLGHDNGTVNYFKKDGNNYTASYRIYRAANSDESDWFGVTTQHATIWGDYVYFSSKQGNRFVVADAKTMKKKAIVPGLGGDGRSFVGIDDTKGYIGHSGGVVAFDISQLQLGKAIEGVTGQIGTMCLAEGRVFAISQQNGLYVINAKTDVVEQTIAGSYNTLTCSKDGDVWVAMSNKFIKLNPLTLEREEINFPAGITIVNSWGAWNAGSLCASTQKNVLYWVTGGGMFGAGGKTVVSYDIDTKIFNADLYTCKISDLGTQLEFYAAGLRVDPLTDELILTVKHSGWGASGAYNWIYKLDSNGQEITHFEVKGDNGSGASWGGNEEEWDGKYFWFPAMPFFEDANRPQIRINQIVLKPGAKQVVDLDEKIEDYDNTRASIQKLITLENNDLVTAVLDGSELTITAGDKPGKTSGALTVISNGVRVSKTIRIDVEK